MPRILVPPGFGISTIRTGPGKYDPDDMRFHSLYRLPVRFPSNCSIVTPSGPAAPPFSLIFSQASHTSIFGMSYDLPCNLGSLTRLIPLGLTAFINQDGPSPWLHPHYRASQLLRDGPPACPATGTLPLTDSAARVLPLATRRCHFGALPSHVPYESLDRAHAACMPDAAWAVNGYPPDSSQDKPAALVLTSPYIFRHVHGRYFLPSSRSPTDTLTARLFRAAHHEPP